MIVFDRKEKEIKVPEGLGNINLTVVDANLEDKTVEINEVEITILPSSGYNGMSSLQIDAQPVYDNGYSQGENIGYNSGYTAGDADGYNRGYNEGETAQKAKLTGITITENGTYTSEDGYDEVVVEVPDLNGDYSEGYDAGKVDGYDSGYTAGIDYASENAEEIAAANAIDLVATEFTTYYTKYSDNIVNPNPLTGIYPDGETFHNLAKVNNNVYNTGIIPNENTKLEFWFKPDLVKDVQDGDWFSIAIDAEKSDIDCFRIRHNNSGTRFSYEFSIKDSRIIYDLIDGINHIEMSYADGLIVNGVKVDDFEQNISNDFNKPFYINGEPIIYEPPLRTDDGEFGMIKITTDGITNIIIPTEDGFKNITTNQLLETVYNEGTYEYINNDPIILDNLIKTVSVQPKINVEKYGIKFGYSRFKELPDFYDFSNITDMSNMFRECGSLQTIPLIDTSNVTNMGSMFHSCSSLQTIPLIDTSKVTNMGNMFNSCGSLRTIPLIDTSNVTEMGSMFSDANIETLPELDTRNVISMNGFLRKYGGMQKLTSLPKFNVPNLTNIGGYFYYSQVTMNNLTEVGGWENLKCNWNDNSGLVCCPNLTYQSCINILNGLYDFTGNGETPASNQGNLKVHSNFLTTVGDEISIGVLKGWSISSN